MNIPTFWPYSGTSSAVNALLESTENKKYKNFLENKVLPGLEEILRHTKETIRLLILYQQSTLSPIVFMMTTSG